MPLSASLPAFVLASAVVTAPAGAVPGTATPGKAAAVGVHVSWVRADSASSCPDASHLEADVTRRLGRAVFFAPASISIEVSVSRSEKTWRASIEMRGADGSSLGSRTVTSEAASCASLASAASLAMALMIDRFAPPGGSVRAAGPGAAPASAASPAVAPPASAASPPVPATAQPAPAPARSAQESGPPPLAPALSPGRTSSFPSGSLAVLATAASQVLPRASFGLGIAADIDLSDRFYLSVGGNFFPQERVTTADIDVAFSMTWGALGACYRVMHGGRFEVAGCASGLVGAMHSVVFTAVPWQHSERLWLGALVGPRFSWSVAEPFEIRAQVEAMVPAPRHTYAVERPPPETNIAIFTEPAVSAIASIGLGLRY